MKKLLGFFVVALIAIDISYTLAHSATEAAPQTDVTLFVFGGVMLFLILAIASSGKKKPVQKITKANKQKKQLIREMGL